MGVKQVRLQHPDAECRRQQKSDKDARLCANVRSRVLDP